MEKIICKNCGDIYPNNCVICPECGSHEIEEDQVDHTLNFENFVKAEWGKLNPLELVKKTFPEDVMKAICSDHHKSKDGFFSIHYSYWDEKWYISHPGYCREAEAEGSTFQEAAEEYLNKIEDENRIQLFHGKQEEVNRALPKEIYIELDEDSISIYESDKHERLSQVSFRKDLAKMSVEEIVKLVTGELDKDY